jgi:hypothetical protein
MNFVILLNLVFWLNIIATQAYYPELRLTYSAG